MAALPLIAEAGASMTLEQRVELILDLTRRLCRLEGLLTAARQRKQARDSEINLSEFDDDELDELEAL
jgi:hypothetical protein